MTEMREQILAAAEQVVRAKGLAGATTKEIARVAGCSEGTLYNHFRDKEDLVVSAILGRVPEVIGLLGSLTERAGTGTVAETVEELVGTALRFYQHLLPAMLPVLGEPDLLRKRRDELREHLPESAPPGPISALFVIGEYLRAEQRLGRVSATVDAEVCAGILLGSVHSFVLVKLLDLGEELAISDDRFVKETARAFVDGLAPRSSGRPTTIKTKSTIKSRQRSTR